MLVQISFANETCAVVLTVQRPAGIITESVTARIVMKRCKVSVLFDEERKERLNIIQPLAGSR